MNKRYSINYRSRGLLAGALVLGATAALAVPVTFRVDMSHQVTLGTFVNGSYPVTASGTFNSWGKSFVLTNNLANTNIFEGTVDVAGAAGSIVEFKFVFNDGGEKWESVSPPNRYFFLEGSPMTLPTVYYDDAWGGTTPIPILFQVNMSAQQAAGNFDPINDLVEVRGAFNGWSTGTVLTNTPGNPNVYQTSVDFTSPPGAQFEYKFVIKKPASDTWESRSSGRPSDYNRYVVTSAGSQTLPVVFFSDVTGVPTKAALFFQVNMLGWIQAGRFDTANEQVFVRGNTFGWGAPPEGVELFADPARPGIYTNLWTRTNQLTGAIIEYKNTIWNSATSATVWEGGANKSVSFTGTEPTNPDGYHLITLPTVYFDNVRPGDFLAADTLVTFRVDMNGAQGYGGNPPSFDTNTMGVWINGDMLTNSATGQQGWDVFGFWGTKPPETSMFDDGTNGDAVAGDQIYSWQTLLKQGTKSLIYYKYGIDSGDNEAPSGQNHLRYVRGTGTYLMPLDKFGTQYQEPAFGNLKAVPGAPGSVDLSWLGLPSVQLQAAPAVTGVYTNVPGTTGQNGITVPAAGAAQFFRLVQQ